MNFRVWEEIITVRKKHVFGPCLLFDAARVFNFAMAGWRTLADLRQLRASVLFRCPAG